MHKTVEAFNNIVASSSQNELQYILQKCGCVPQLVSLMSSDHKKTQEHAIWVLCNIALDECDTFRIQLMQEGALETLAQVIVAYMYVCDWLCDCLTPSTFGIPHRLSTEENSVCLLQSGPLSCSVHSQ